MPSLGTYAIRWRYAKIIITMELILLQDVEKLGFKDEIVKVKNGYGRNFLIPSGHAVLATDSARKVLAENLRQRAKKENKVIEDATN